MQQISAAGTLVSQSKGRKLALAVGRACAGVRSVLKGRMRGEMRWISLLQASLAFLLLGSAASLAHHDDIPDPPPESASELLPADLQIDPTSVTVSGLSSGGFFAHQFHVAFSSTVGGAAILAGGPLRLRGGHR